MQKQRVLKIFKNRMEAALFVLSFSIALIFFIWQKNFFSWDFSVYIMNAECVFKGIYLERLRAPLVSWIMIPFLIFSRQVAIYAFTIMTTIFYFLALKLFHDKFLSQYKNSEIFYLIAINPFILGFGLGMGSELLSLALIILFFTFAFSYSSFIFLGLAMLTRYSNIILFPLIFFQKSIKKILLGILILLIVFFPWFLINYLGTGHALTSLGDYYALNSLEQAKPQLEIGKFISHLFTVLNVLIPFILVGIFSLIKKWKKLEKKEKILVNLLIIISVLTVLTYLFNPLKDSRYLFNLIFPATYFSFLGLSFILEKIKIKKNLIIRLIFIIFFTALAISTFFIMESRGRGLDKELILTKQIIHDLHNNCTISSDLWVYFNWQNRGAIPSPFAVLIQNESQISLMTKEGYNIILFKPGEAYQKNILFIQNLNTSIIEDNNNYIWIHNNDSCKQTEKVNMTYMDSMKSFGEFSQDFTGCDALLLRLKLTKICRILPFL
ncbi:MAG: hypothetical protein NTX24_03800 [Candidatus Pacearchaeota archaeon]|nr:hypothetical protein [Candidatus Pacearchaeota archaeon]